MLKLLLIRHAETVWNAAGRIQGQADPGLSERGLDQVEALRRRAPELGIGRVFASDLTRARDTAAALGPGATPTPGLREVSVGQWEGLTRAELAADWPREYAAWRARPSWDLVPGGETTAAFAGRVRAALASIMSRAEDGETVAAVTHIGVIRVALSDAFGLPVAEPRWAWTVENTGITALALPAGGWEPSQVEVLAVNDAAHLDRRP